MHSSYIAGGADASVLQSPSVTALIRIDRSWTPAGEGRPKPIRFCSRCGHPAEDPPGRPELRKRVCARCGMGLILTCPRDALPGETRVFPGHMGLTTLERERTTNPFLQELHRA